MNRRTFAIVALLLAAVAVTWYVLAPAPGPAPVTPSVPAGAAVSATATPVPSRTPTLSAAAPPVRALTLPAPLRDRERPLIAVYAELLQWAERGNVEAMLELGHRLQPCTALQLNELRHRIDDEGKQLPPRTAANAANAQQLERLAALQARLGDCEAVAALTPASGLSWMERAAEQGYGPAQLSYVDNAFAEFDAAEPLDVVDAIEEIVRRRELARRFLAEAMTHCVAGALSQQARSSAVLFDVADPKAYAIARAAAADAVWREARDAGADPGNLETLQHEFDNLAASLDEVTKAAARRQGEAMYQTCASREH